MTDEAQLAAHEVERLRRTPQWVQELVTRLLRKIETMAETIKSNDTGDGAIVVDTNRLGRKLGFGAGATVAFTTAEGPIELWLDSEGQLQARCHPDSKLLAGGAGGVNSLVLYAARRHTP